MTGLTLLRNPSLRRRPARRVAAAVAAALVVLACTAGLGQDGEAQAVAVACLPGEAVEVAGPPASAAMPGGEPAAQSSEATQPLDARQQALVQYLSRRYLVAAEATGRMVLAAHDAAQEVGLDPLLLLAVISIESRFNPIAESGMGAKGLMQIIPRYHLDKLSRHGGEEAVLDPESNIRVGARILQEYVYRTGTLVGGLQFYNGASWDPTAQYAQKVMAEREKLEQVVRLPRTVTASVESRGS